VTTLRTYTLRAVLIAAALVLVAAVAPAAAKAKTPCWKTLINDWYDGRIDGTYPIPCYREALKHLPSDVDAYSSAREDIKQALQIRLTQGVNAPKTQTTPKNKQTTTGEDGGNNQGAVPPGSGNNDGGGGGPSGTTPNSSTPSPGGDRSTKGRDAGNPLVPSAGSPDSVPIPLIVLGSIAALLMAAGAVGFLTRRARARRLQLASAAAVAQRPGDSPPAK
jgi:hypothetical protein